MEVSLQEIFNFTDADLKENREGRLSNTQKNNLRRFVVMNTALSIIGSALSLLFAVEFVQSVAGLHSSRFSSYPVILAFFTVTIGAGSFAVLSNAFKMNTEASIGEVEIIEGEISLLLSHRKTSTRGLAGRHYRLIVDSSELIIDRQQYNQMSDADAGIYRVYYLPEMSKPVSLERIKLSNP